MDKRVWTVYYNLEPTVDGQMMNSIFVLNPESQEVVLTIMGVRFAKLPVASFCRAFCKRALLRSGRGRFSMPCSRDSNPSQLMVSMSFSSLLDRRQAKVGLEVSRFETCLYLNSR